MYVLCANKNIPQVLNLFPSSIPFILHLSLCMFDVKMFDGCKTNIYNTYSKLIFDWMNLCVFEYSNAFVFILFFFSIFLSFYLHFCYNVLLLLRFICLCVCIWCTNSFRAEGICLSSSFSLAMQLEWRFRRLHGHPPSIWPNIPSKQMHLSSRPLLDPLVASPALASFSTIPGCRI